MKRAILLTILVCLAFCQSGCTAIVAAQLRGKLPAGHVGEAKITVNIPVAGGGSLHVKDATKGADGTLKVGEYHSEIQTAYGMVKVDILDGQLSEKK